MIVKAVSKNAVILGAVAAICVALLSIINQLAQPKIRQQVEVTKLAILQEVLPGSLAEQKMLADCISVTEPEILGRDTPQSIYRWRQNGELSAYIVETTAPDGYSGNIDLIVAVAPDGTVIGSRVLQHSETPGLGDKIESRRSEWIFSFANQPVTVDNAKAWAVKKDGGQFDQFTGATITPRAVIKAIRNAALFVRQHPELANQTANCQENAT